MINFKKAIMPFYFSIYSSLGVSSIQRQKVNLED